MSLSLELLDQQRQRLGPNFTEIVFLRCLTTCQQRTREIQQLVDSMTRRMEQHARLRGKLYFAFKDQDVEDLFGRLEKAKSSLQMAYAMYQAEVTQNLLASQGKTLLGPQAHIIVQDTDTSPVLVPVSTTKSGKRGQSRRHHLMYRHVSGILSIWLLTSTLSTLQRPYARIADWKPHIGSDLAPRTGSVAKFGK